MFKQHANFMIWTWIWLFKHDFRSLDNGFKQLCAKLSMQEYRLYYVTRGDDIDKVAHACTNSKWTASSEFGTYSLCEQRRFRRACASAQSRQNLRCSLIQAVSQEEPSDRKPDLWPLWMAGHAQLKFVMTECSKTQIRLARLTWTLMWSNLPLRMPFPG